MSRHFENINIWAEKLQQVSVPDAAPQWQAMAAMLDAQMPVANNKHWKRWLLLIILLLLLIGVCNCPGVIGVNKFSAKTDLPVNNLSSEKNDATKSKINSSPEKNINQKKTGKDNKKTNKDLEIAEKKKDEINISKKNDNEKTDQLNVEPSNENKNNPEKKDNILSDRKKINHSSTIINGIPSSQINKSVADKIKNNQPDKSKKVFHDKTSKNQPEQTVKLTYESNDNSPFNKIIASHDSASTKKNKSIDSTKINTVETKKEIKKDASKKKQQTADSIEDEHGFLLAIGLNQFFPVGDQQKSNYNSNGTSGSIGDYIPVPVARYYFHKWLYVQMEAQINTPQYTKTLLAGVNKGVDTVNSVFIKKLFYFNIPLSVHFRPIKNLYIGAGLQYSLLTNGVALAQQSRAAVYTNVITNVIPPSDTAAYIASKIENFKSTPEYKELKTYEFRFLFDVNYQWKPLTLGLRYNQSFTNFINVHISNTVITQSHNSSLQLYLRYTLWNNLKRIKLPAK